MKIEIPEFCVVVLVGTSGSGKSTFARKHFLPTEILSSDFFRGLVADDETDQAATGDAFDMLHAMLATRLKRMRLTVIDATNVQAEDRKQYVTIAKQYHTLAVAIVLNTPKRICIERNQTRPDRNFGPHVIERQHQALRSRLRNLEREGFRYVHILNSPEDADRATIERTRVWNNRRDELGPFDLIGDIHGCCDELEELLTRLGYHEAAQLEGARPEAAHPEGRKAVFVGDLVDRGPRIADTVRLVKRMVDAGAAICVPGNHDAKLARYLQGRPVKIAHGLQQSIDEFEQLNPVEKAELGAFLDKLISHYVLDGGRLVVAHAGLKEEMQGRTSGAVREFCLYGETTGETDEFGLPVRFNWANEYRGKAMVVYGHTPVPEPEWLNNTINVDTGCVFGGKLTALRYPERELVSVAARRVYCEPLRPFLQKPDAGLGAQAQADDLLDLADVSGKRWIETAHGRIPIRAEQATPALEVMSRFAMDPRWLIYLPPTMSPTETSARPDSLEHPDEAFAHFRAHGVETVVCEEKHMGSRAIVIVCRDPEVARRRFGVREPALGACYTRTGRAFFQDPDEEQRFLERIHPALEPIWTEFETDWICLDCELLPWSAKARELIREQYAAVGAAGETSLRTLVELTARRPELASSASERLNALERFRAAYRKYCWSVNTVTDLKLAPFHILATEGRAHVDKNNQWHMETAHRIAARDPAIWRATPYRVLRLDDDAACQAAADWWEELTASGGEGMVVKPLEFVTRGPKGMVQPALKVRGREYLRIIYGPEYTRHIGQLRRRTLSVKRNFALREFQLGLEALDRFVRREPLRRVHECVFGVLALESEPVDPRL